MRIDKNPAAPAPHELIPGVVWTLRPITGPIKLAVEAKVQRRMAALREGRGALEAMGFDGDDFGILKDPEILFGLSMFEAACCFAQALLVEWTGLEDEAGQALALDEDNIRAALNFSPDGGAPVLLSPFIALIDGPRWTRQAEGNGCAPLPNGSLVGAQTTVPDAPMSAQGAPRAAKTRAARPVPRSSTNPAQPPE
jgi:hypothetical protein